MHLRLYMEFCTRRYILALQSDANSVHVQKRHIIGKLTLTDVPVPYKLFVTAMRLTVRIIVPHTFDTECCRRLPRAVRFALVCTVAFQDVARIAFKCNCPCGFNEHLRACYSSVLNFWS